MQILWKSQCNELAFLYRIMENPSAVQYFPDNYNNSYNFGVFIDDTNTMEAKHSAQIMDMEASKMRVFDSESAISELTLSNISDNLSSHENTYGNHSYDLEDFHFLNSSIYETLPNMDAVSGDLQTFIVVMYSLTAVLSVVGNISVIVVLVFGRRWVAGSVFVQEKLKSNW